MPRVPRSESEPGIYHVYARGNRKQPIFHDDRDRRRYLALLEDVRDRGPGGGSCRYCLMGNHMHLLIETQEPNLGSACTACTAATRQYFNRRHGFSGHLFQDRYDSVVDRGRHPTLDRSRVHRAQPGGGRPARRPPRTTSGAATPTSSTGRCSPDWLDTDRLLSCFATDGGDALERYTALVCAPAQSAQTHVPKWGQSLFKDAPTPGGAGGGARTTAAPAAAR